MVNGNSKKKNNRGVTMVELVVSFALLAIFLVAATMCISHCVIFFFNTRNTMSAYSVADIVFDEIEHELSTMQSSDYNGYVKLRDKQPDGTLSSVACAGGAVSGDSIEFVTSSLNNGANAVQLDANGCECAIIDKERIVKENIDNIKSGYLTLRYYSRYQERKMNLYKNLYMDQVMSGSSAEESSDYSGLVGKSVVWHAEEKLPASLYQGYTVSFKFSVNPETDSEGHYIVRYVDVDVIMNDDDGLVYEKERRIELQNKVYYNNENTMYSDGPGSI